MPVEFPSDEQVARYGHFAVVPWVGELERFFRLDACARELAAAKRRPATRLGWAVQWGTVRMLGTFLTEEPRAVPGPVAGFVAKHLDLDSDCFAEFGTRSKTAYEPRGGSATRWSVGTSRRRRVSCRCGSSWQRGCGCRRRDRGHCLTGRWCGWRTTLCCCRR